MSDYSQRLHRKMMKGETEKEMPPSPHRVIGHLNPSLVTGEQEQEPQARGNSRLYFSAFTATLGNLVMGTTIAWSSPSGPLLAKSPAEGGFGLSDEENSWVGCLMPAGALVGALFAGFLMSRLGRKGGMMTAAALFAVSYVLLVAAPNVWFIYAGRLATGLCTGISSAICPIYVAEISPASLRGLLGACVQLMVTFGIMLVVAAGVFNSWRWISVSCLVMTMLWMLCLLFIPESPTHYLTKKNYADARESLEWLRKTINVENEFGDLQRSTETSTRMSAGLGDLLKAPNLAPFIVSLWLMLGQQLSGMNAIMFYAVSIFEDSGSKMNSNVENIIVNVVQIVATVISAAVMDKAGRRLLLNLSSLFMVISIGILGVFFYILKHDPVEAHKISTLPVVSLSVFVLAFSIGFGPIPWLMMSELFSPEIKSLASSVSTTFNWTLAFLVTKFFTTLVTGITEAGAFWFFAGFNILTFIFCLLFVPETKGKSLEEIQEMFRSDKPYFFNISVWRLCAKEQREDDRPLVTEAVY